MCVCVCVCDRTSGLAGFQQTPQCMCENTRVGQKINDMLHNFSCIESTRILIIPGNLSPSGYQCRRLEESLGGNKIADTRGFETVVAL